MSDAPLETPTPISPAEAAAKERDRFVDTFNARVMHKLARVCEVDDALDIVIEVCEEFKIEPEDVGSILMPDVVAAIKKAAIDRRYKVVPPSAPKRGFAI